jgi:hypothetical protein
MRRKFLALCAALAVAPRAFAQKTGAAGPPAGYRGVYAEIDMRPAEAMVKRLEPVAGNDHRTAMREVLKDPSSHMPPVFYALANALAEDYPDEGVFWYHAGRVRAVYDALRCRDVTVRREIPILGKTLSVPLRSAQFYQRGNLVGIAEKAIAWDKKSARNYDQRWITLYGDVAMKSDGADPAALFLPESEWPGILQQVHDTHLQSVRDFANEKKGK